MDNNNPKIEKKLTLKNDVIFQTFFSRKGNEEFLKQFLSALLKIDIKKIEIKQEVTLERMSILEKGGRLDLQATLNDDTVVSIEMQMHDEGDMEERTGVYAGKVRAETAIRGQKYNEAPNVIMINILNFNCFDNVDEYISETVTVLKKHRDHEISTGMKWYFIELPKFRKAKPDMNEVTNQWLALIDSEDGELIKMAEKKNKVIKSALDEVEHLTGDEEVRRLAELKERWEQDRISGLSATRKKGIEEGKKERRKNWN